MGAVFQEDGLYKIVFRLDGDSWPRATRFSSLEEMLNALLTLNLPFDQLTDFVFAGLQLRIRLLRQLPGSTADWAQFAR